jgi:DNA-binding beta-propeller fold protein YncE
VHATTHPREQAKRERNKLLYLCCALLAGLLWGSPALALTVEITTPEPSLVGDAFTFRAVVQDAVGVVQYRWTFGDGTPRLDFAPGGGEVSHLYAQPGHFFVQVAVKDSETTTSTIVPHLVHHPPKTPRATSSSSIVYDQARQRIYVVNQDNDSITSIDAVDLKKVTELPVYRRPEALALTAEGKLWVVHKDDYAVAVVDPDRFVIERGFRLPYASQPVGLAINPAGKDAYITLMALGKLLKLDTTTGEMLGQVEVGASARGVSVSHDGKNVYVTRFISPNSGGEVVQVDGPAMKIVSRIVLATDTDILDTDRAARGLPNYLFSVGISPDGRQAWVAGKKDNILRGAVRDGLALNQDDTVRPMVAIIDVAQGMEVRAARVDLDDRSLPAHVAFSPLGNFAFVTVAASNIVEVRDVYAPGTAWAIISDAGIAPRAAVLGPNNRLFVQGWLSRSVAVFDLTDIMVSFERTTPTKVADIGTVEVEKLDPKLLLGKRLFHGAGDMRMTSEGYLTCATCHFEGAEDGRVYDFTSRGEGLRNTTSLLGRAGIGHGRINWSANFDEVQDFETQIRELFVGRGFIADDLLAMGRRSDPLGDPKAGLSVELDALAAFVTSFDQVNPSPFRNPDGSLTADGLAGKVLFAKLGCDFCHGGRDFTDSGRGMLHDVGTLSSTSGKRSGMTLAGIDTPTLLGVWETAPYLHDGSAATLREVLTTRNSSDAHGFVSALGAQEIDHLVAYLLQIDDELPAPRLPFEPPVKTGPGGAGGSNPGAGGSAGGGQPPEARQSTGCGCAVSTGGADGVALLTMTVGLLLGRRGPGRRGRSSEVAR